MYIVSNEQLLLDSSIVLNMHKIVISYCLTGNYIYCLTVKISGQKITV
jgi:hypothetical protein